MNGVTSELQVTSGVPQGSVIIPDLFIIYVNDIDLGLNNFISKFAEDKKIRNAVLSGDRRSLSPLRKISDWSVKWGMHFNINKSQILHVGSRNVKKKYEMLSVKIKSVHLEYAVQFWSPFYAKDIVNFEGVSVEQPK